MININSKKNFSRLRRIALANQGLLASKPFGRGISGAKKAIEHIGYVQIDTISVIERAHNHVLQARVPGFKTDMINRMLVNRDIFEYWSHAAAFLPIDDYRFSLPYKQALKSGQTHWYKNPDRKLMTELLARVKGEGPLRSRDIEHNAPKRAGWWDWKPAKRALEQLYMEGDLMVTNRDGFQKAYDLTERVLPSDINTAEPSVEEFASHLIEQQLRCHGFVSLKGFTYLRKNVELRKRVKTQVEEGVASGSLEQMTIAGGETFYAKASAFEQPLPRVPGRVKILSPFDNSVIQRDRLKAVFDFDYQIECYVPEPKRKFGYFTLPLLYRDKFIGRMDCKAHRKQQHFEVKALYFEPHQLDMDEVISAFVAALLEFAEFNECVSTSVTKVMPVAFEQPIKSALDNV